MNKFNVASARNFAYRSQLQNNFVCKMNAADSHASSVEKRNVFVLIARSNGKEQLLKTFVLDQDQRVASVGWKTSRFAGARERVFGFLC